MDMLNAALRVLLVLDLSRVELVIMLNNSRHAFMHLHFSSVGRSDVAMLCVGFAFVHFILINFLDVFFFIVGCVTFPIAFRICLFLCCSKKNRTTSIDDDTTL